MPSLVGAGADPAALELIGRADIDVVGAASVAPVDRASAPAVGADSTAAASTPPLKGLLLVFNW